MMVLSVSTASGAIARASALTTSTRLAAIVAGLFGLPPGLAETPGRQLVDRLPPRGIVCLSLPVRFA
jgi:TctA family transporter